MTEPTDPYAGGTDPARAHPAGAHPEPYPTQPYPPQPYPQGQPYPQAPADPYGAQAPYGVAPYSAQPYSGQPYLTPAGWQPASDKSKVVAGLLQLLPGFLFTLGGIGRLYAGQNALGA